MKLMWVLLSGFISLQVLAYGPGTVYKYENQKVPRVSWPVVPGHLVYFPQAV